MKSDYVKILVHADEKPVGTFELSRVPCRGEYIRTSRAVFEVKDVIHNAAVGKMYDAGVDCVVKQQL
jgi:hypothetical protein